MAGHVSKGGETGNQCFFTTGGSNLTTERTFVSGIDTLLSTTSGIDDLTEDREVVFFKKVC